MTMWSSPPEPWYQMFVIHGPAYEQARAGGYWGLDDELFWHARVVGSSARGVVVISCLDQEDADRVRGVIEGLGLVAGRDYAMQCESGQRVETPEVKWRHSSSLDDCSMQPVANIDWSPGPKPPEVDELFSKLHDYLYDVRWPTLRDVAIRRGVKPETIEEASRQPTDYERWRFLNDAMLAKHRRAMDEAAARHQPVLLSHTFGHWLPARNG
jgi:hypothetical protein